jgi:multiple sugar transport system permease protein
MATQTADRVLAPAQPTPDGPRRRRKLPFSPFHLLLAPIALLFLMPLLQMVMASFKTDAEIRQFPPTWFPTDPTISGYVALFQQSSILRWMLNSTLVTSVAIVSNLVLCSLAGYGFARMKFLGRNFSFVALIATIMIPTQLLMVPLFILMTKVHIVNTLPALMLPWLASAFGVFLMRQFFLTLPRELEEAARLDGCSALGVFWRVILPLAKPAMTTLAIFTLLGAWNDLIWPLIAVQNQDLYTMQIGIANFQGTRRAEWQMIMAGNVIATMPMVIFFLAAQRQFVATMTFSGMKG